MSRGNPSPRRQAAALLLALSVAVIAACGGGGGSAPTPSAAADPPVAGPPAVEASGAYAAGPIEGFGSIIVNGIRYDDSDAEVTDDDGQDGRGRLKLGMQVEIDSQPVDHGRAVAKAMRIRFASEIVGPVTAVDTAAATLTVLGQTVVVTEETIFDDSLGSELAALEGTVIAVHAQLDAASGHYTARRIEPATAASAFALRGRIANLDTTLKTFTIGALPISYAGLAPRDLPPRLADGALVRVRLDKEAVDGVWQAISARPGMPAPGNRDDARVRGAITAFTSTATFEVNGLLVDASAANFPGGSDGLALGSPVVVDGRIVDGVLIAAQVRLDRRPVHDRSVYELHGAIGALDTVARSFVLRGMRVSYGDEVTFTNGSAADLANGRKVEVKGTPGADRRTLVADTIEFEG